MTVDVCDTPNKYESSKTVTVTGMATATHLIPVTVRRLTDTQKRYWCRHFFVLTLNAGSCFTSQMEPQTWPNAVVQQSSQWCCLPYICNLPRGSNLADVAIFVASHEFQVKYCTQPLNIPQPSRYFVMQARCKKPLMQRLQEASAF